MATLGMFGKIPGKMNRENPKKKKEKKESKKRKKEMNKYDAPGRS